TQTGNMTTSTSPLRMGGNSVWGEYFKGLIDEVRIYNRALSGAEIQSDRDTPIGGGPGGVRFDGLPSAPRLDDLTLSEAQLSPIVAEARSRWAKTGLTPQQTAALNSALFHIANLPGSELGFTSSREIWIDRDAAGYGWFVDATPSDDSEFPATPTSPAYGKVDLLTVVAHELGHSLGLEHSEARDVNNVMAD